MEPAQRRILRRKKPIIAELLSFSEDDQQEYKSRGLLTDKMIREIKSEKTALGQLYKFLDTIPLLGTGAFDSLGSLLAERGHAWLRDEMQAGLLAEKGELAVDEYVYREAGMMIHRYWGGSKRLSENDKKEFQSILATFYQTAKEASRLHVMYLQESLEESEQTKEDLSIKVSTLCDKLQTYMEINKGLLTTNDSRRPVDLILQDTDLQPDDVNKLDTLVEAFLQITSRLSFEKDIMEGERKRCLKLLNADKNASSLDSLVEEMLIKSRETKGNGKGKGGNYKEEMDALRKRVNQLRGDMGREIEAKQREIQLHMNMVEEREERIRELERANADMQPEVDQLKEELSRWKKRSEQLERTRRLGYYQKPSDDAPDNNSDNGKNGIYGNSSPDTSQSDHLPMIPKVVKMNISSQSPRKSRHPPPSERQNNARNRSYVLPKRV